MNTQDSTTNMLPPDVPSIQRWFSSPNPATFRDVYEVQEQLGSPGTFGTAYKCCLREDPNQVFAAKIIAKTHFFNAKRLRKFVTAETNILRLVDHPNLVKFYDVFEDDENVYLVMELCRGGELFDYIQEQQRLPEEEVKSIVAQLLSAISYLHNMDVSHLDLKPSNILFPHKGCQKQIKIIDFGMASCCPRLKKTIGRRGTVLYMAPEMLSSRPQFDRAADLWAIGLIMFTLLFGFHPFQFYLDDETELKRRVRKGFCPEEKDDFGPWFPAAMHVSDEARSLMSKLLAKKVRDRCTAVEGAAHEWVRDARMPLTLLHGMATFTTAHHGLRLLLADTALTDLDTQRHRGIEAFVSRFDEDGDGKLCWEEFQHAMTARTLLTPELIHCLFLEADQTGDGLVSLKELERIGAFNQMLEVDERLYEVFRKLDKNGDGVIDIHEIEAAVEEDVDPSLRGLIRPMSVLNQADIDGNGKIDWDEFVRAVHPVFNESLIPPSLEYLRSVHSTGIFIVDDAEEDVRETSDETLKLLADIEEALDTRDSMESSPPTPYTPKVNLCFTPSTVGSSPRSPSRMIRASPRRALRKHTEQKLLPSDIPPSVRRKRSPDRARLTPIVSNSYDHSDRQRSPPPPRPSNACLAGCVIQ